MDPKEPTCFTCGLTLSDPPRLNRMEDGSTCPTCRDRLLEELPGVFPGGEPGVAGPAREDAVELAVAERRPRGPRPTKG